MSHKTLWLLLILIIAFILRLFQLGTAPRGLHADEVSFSINSQSLLETGKDEDGQTLPWHLNSYIDPKPALYSYLQIPFFHLFGVTTATSRLPSVLLGILSIFLVFVFVKRLMNGQTGLLVTALLAISPWHIMVSRATQEVVLAFVFLMVALIAFQKLQQTHKMSSRMGMTWLLVLFVSAFVCMDTYHANKIFLPLSLTFWSAWQVYQDKQAIKKYVVICCLVIVAGGVSLLTAGSTARFEAVGVLSNLEPQLLLEEQIRQATGQTPLLLLRIFYNKMTFYGLSFLEVYAQHFTLDFFFLSGGQPLRYQVPFHGLFYLIEILLIPVGLLVLVTKKATQRFRWLVVALALLAPIPAALTFIETPSMIRSFPLILPVVILIAVGLAEMWRGKVIWRKYLSIIVVGGGYLWGLGFFWQQFLVQQPIHEPWYRNEPYEKITQEVATRQAEYERIVVTNDLRPLYAYFVQAGLIDWQTLQANSLARNQETYSLDKYTFNRGICDFGPHQAKTLYIAEIQCSADGRELLTTITYGDGLPVYGLWVEAAEKVETAK